jgi:exosortase/archaeosortase family protein
LLATLNAFFGIGEGSVKTRGWAAAAINLFDVSAILWAALAAGLAILGEDGARASPVRGDLPIAWVALAAILTPAPVASTLALTLVSVWVIATSGPGTTLRRSGIVFLALTGALLWGRLLLTYFSRPLLDIDAIFVTSLLGADHSGNVIWSQASGARVVVAAGCSSMRGLSLALVFWAALNQYYRVPFGRRALLTCLAALAATIAVNVLRIAAMLHWPDHIEEIHSGWGWLVAMWANLVLIVAICLLGARRDIFPAR